MAQMRTRTLIIAVACLLVAVAAVVLALPLKTVPYQATETYYETETKKEAYVDREPYTTEEMQQKSEVLHDGSTIMVPYGIIVPFSVDKPGVKVAGRFEYELPVSFYLYSHTGRIVYEQLGTSAKFEVDVPEGKYRARFSESVKWDEEIYIYLELTWTAPEQVTRYRDVTKYREVPVEVPREKTVTKYRKTSIWEWLLGDEQ